jgi:hypothetical protein
MEAILMVMGILFICSFIPTCLFSFLFAWRDGDFREATKTISIVIGIFEFVLFVFFIVSLFYKLSNCCNC